MTAKLETIAPDCPLDDVYSVLNRGMVALVVDHRANLADDRSGKARHALAALANAGCRIRTISVYPIHHDNRNPV